MNEAKPPIESTAGGVRSRLLRSNAFAWSLSMLLHAGLFLVFYRVGFGKSPETRRFIIPEARLAGSPGPLAPQSEPPARRLPDLSPGGAAGAAARAPRLDELPILSVATPAGAARDTVVSGAPALALPGVEGAGGGAGLVGTGAGGGGTAIGPVSRFFGQAGNAYKVVYVVDVSASLMAFTSDIVREMQDSIRDLVPTQEFHIVLAMPRGRLGAQALLEMEPRRLVPANAKYKSMGYDFIKVILPTPDAGEADPVQAMQRAFAVGPELIYFMTDGDYGAGDELLAALKGLNPKADVKITVIGFGLPATDVPGKPVAIQKTLLQRIAREHGGHCRFVDN